MRQHSLQSKSGRFSEPNGADCSAVPYWRHLARKQDAVSSWFRRSLQQEGCRGRRRCLSTQTRTLRASLSRRETQAFAVLVLGRPGLKHYTDTRRSPLQAIWLKPPAAAADRFAQAKHSLKLADHGKLPRPLHGMARFSIAPGCHVVLLSGLLACEQGLDFRLRRSGHAACPFLNCASERRVARTLRP